MATAAEIRNGIKARLDTISGLRAHPRMPAVLNAPAAVPFRRTTAFDSSVDSDDRTFAVTVFVEYRDEPTAQTNLDAYLDAEGDSSVKVAIDGDTTLGGVVDFAVATRVERERITEWAGIKYLAADVVIEVG